MKTKGMHLIPHKLFTEDIKINSPANDYCNNKKQHFLLETTIGFEKIFKRLKEQQGHSV